MKCQCAVEEDAESGQTSGKVFGTDFNLFTVELRKLRENKLEDFTLGQFVNQSRIESKTSQCPG